MLSEFFWKQNTKTIFAWLGLIVFVAHQLFRAYLKYALNSWYEDFYDLLQHSGSRLINEIGSESSHVQQGSGEHGSGPYAYAFSASIGRELVKSKIVDFFYIVAPGFLLHPLAGFIKNLWILEWRLTLMKAYITHWDIGVSPLEGAAQRVHEDTQRFARGIHTCFSTLFEAFLTLIIFCPVLYDLMPFLMIVAIAFPAGGLLTSALVGYHLVDMEVSFRSRNYTSPQMSHYPLYTLFPQVQNQKVEASLRRQLVVLEIDPTSISTEQSVVSAFYCHLQDLKRSYRALYCNFAVLATWLATYEQAAVVIPYLWGAPLLFADSVNERITLGTLVKMSNAFSKVFDSFNIVSDNWMQVNEWRSTLRRLFEFERSLYDHQTRARLRVHPVPPATELTPSHAARSTSFARKRNGHHTGVDTEAGRVSDV